MSDKDLLIALTLALVAGGRTNAAPVIAREILELLKIELDKL